MLLAVSGGVDSLVLFDAFCRLKDELGLRLHVAHLDHMLRGNASQGDAQHVAEVARSHSIPCTVERVDITSLLGCDAGGVQEVARRERYAFFRRLSSQLGARWIATGHHRDDQAETVLWRIIRGTGLPGLRGIPPVGDGLLRPLMGLWRQELEEYRKAAGLLHREDASNERLDYTRNRIRLQVLPLLEELNPQVKQALISLSELAGRDGDFLERSAHDFYRRLADVHWGQRRLCRRRLGELHEAVASRIFIRAVRDAHAPALPELDQATVGRALALIANTTSQTRFMLPGEVTVVVEKGWVTLVPPHDSLPQRRVELGGVTPLGRGMYITARLLSQPPHCLDAGAKSAYIDFARVDGSLRVRSRRSGDRFCPLGLTGSKSLKEFFIQEKVPAYARDRVPVIYADNGIVWLGGLRPDHRFRVRESTRIVLQLRLREMLW